MGNSASSLPYTIGQQVAVVNHGWTLHDGSQKSDGASVSVFTAKKPALSKTPVDRSNPNLMQLTPALQHYQNCKKLRHPYILSVYATLDTDHPNDTGGSAGGAMGSTTATAAAAATETGDYMIVTEPCVPLNHWLQQSPQPPPEQLAWGLECAVRALHFLHASANLSHGNISPESFYVTPAGDVKLWNFSLATTVDPTTGGLSNVFCDYESLVTPQPYRSPERCEQRYKEIAQAGSTHSMDSYGMSVLLQHFFQHQLPAPLVKAVQRMQTPNVRMRPRLQPLLKCPIFDTPYQKLQLQLETLAVLPVEEKIGLWQTMLPQLQAQLIAEPVVVYKLLPMMKASVVTICTSDMLKQQEVYRKEVLAILQPLFYVAQNYLDGSSFSKELGGIIALLFQVNDRGIRGTLLQKATVMAENLDSNTLNQAVFEPMCSGFSDSSAALRELTLKATLVLLPKLTHPNLEKLSRYLVRLQADPEAAIRTNTIIYFGKLAPHLTDIGRNKMLMPAFVRAMKDPFTPCRLEALRFANKVKQYFDPPSIAGKVLPALTPYLLDPSVDVRRECFQVVDDLLFMIRQEGEKMPVQPEALQNAPTYSVGNVPNNAAPTRAPLSAPPQRTVAAQGAAPPLPPAAPSSGGYLSGLSSWMTSSAKPTSEPAMSTASLASTPAGPQQQAPILHTASAPLPVTSSSNIAPSDDDGWGDEDDDDGDGWGDESGLMDDSFSGHGTAAEKPSNGSAANLFAATASPDEGDFFNSMDTKAPKPVIASRTMGAPKSKLVIPPKVGAVATKLAVTKLSIDDDNDDGWDDF